LTLITDAPAWLFALLIVLLAAAAVEDMWRLQIEDEISGAIALSAVVAALFVVVREGGGWWPWQNILLMVLVLVVGTLLFARGAMGGGDVKLWAACALWFDLTDGWKMAVAVALAGGIEALLLFTVRRLPWPAGLPERWPLLKRGGEIPYGVAIAGGVLLMAWWLR
jgi:prepilin peptidase CpaA